MGLLFSHLPPSLGAPGLRGGALHGDIEPAGQSGAAGQSRRFARQIGENALADVLGPVGVAAELTQRRGMNPAEMALHELPKSRLRAGFGVLAEQFAVVGHGPFIYNLPPFTKPNEESDGRSGVPEKL